MEQGKKINLSQWISGAGPEQDIVLSNRIRLARNINKIPFPGKAKKEDLAEIVSMVKEVVSKQDDFKLFFIKIKDLPQVEKNLLVEKNLTSPAHLNKEAEAALFLNNEENISIMVNEEDHIRIQILTAGFQLEKSWKVADEIDDLLEDKLDFAFSKKIGYLSACPTNLGTGLRASVMVHLPALNVTNNIGKMLGAISQLGLVVRGIYGEGSESSGNIYQISNQITLGNSEKEIIDNLKSVTTQIIEEERNIREKLMKKQKIQVKDKIMRSYGILKYVQKIASDEAMELLSNVKLGIDMGIIDSLDSKVLSELLILIRPAHLQKSEGEELSSRERDIKRASLIRNRLTNDK